MMAKLSAKIFYLVEYAHEMNDHDVHENDGGHTAPHCVFD